MSNQSPSKTNPKPRVSGGVPWWIWGIMAILGGGIIVALVQKSIPEDPAELFEQALVAADKQDANTVKSVAGKLSEYPDFATKKKFLDGILMLGNSRPLKAIDLLKDAAEEPGIRVRALMMLGTAYAQAENMKASVETFQSVLKEDPNAEDARFRLASIYKDLLALDLAVSNLDVLIANKFRLAATLKMRGDIRFDRREFGPAAEDYEAAINSDKNNQSAGKGFFEAEKLLQDGDLKKLAVALETIRSNASFDPRGHVLYGKMMLKEGTADKAAEGLAGLQVNLQLITRNVELFKVVAELARVAGDEKMALAAQQNVEQLQLLDKEYNNQLAQVSATQDGYDDRIKLAQLAREIGQYDFAMTIYQSMGRAYPEKSSELSTLQDNLFSTLPPLVSLPGLLEQTSETGDKKTDQSNPPEAKSDAASPTAEPAAPSEQK
jgi:tetratricopeptide (TPR) repeat protein